MEVTEEAVLKGHRCLRTKLWRVPLKPMVKNKNQDTLLLDTKYRIKLSNLRYKLGFTLCSNYFTTTQITMLTPEL